MGSADLPVRKAVTKRGRNSSDGHGISPDDIRAELEKILSSSAFLTADRMRRFLRLVVEETLGGRGDNLNELLLGMAVYDRDKKFDPRVDSIVRVDAGRLRAKLREFYASEGTSSSIAIDIPKGSYKTVFKRLEHNDGQRSRTKDPVAATSLGVLPFADVSPRKDDESLVGGIVEELVHKLSRIPNFRVVSMASVQALKERQIDVREMGRQLGVESFVEGSVRRANREIRVLARLTDVATGFHTWSEVYAFGVRTAFALQETIANSIAEALSVKLVAKRSLQNRKVSK